MLLNVMGVGQALGPAMPFSAIAVTGEMPSTGLVIRVWHMAAHETNRPTAGLRQHETNRSSIATKQKGIARYVGTPPLEMRQGRFRTPPPWAA